MKIYPPEIEEIRAAWKATGLTQHQLAAKVGVRYGVLMNILANSYFAREHFDAVRAALNLRPVTPSAPVERRVSSVGRKSPQAKHGEPAKPENACAVCRTSTSDFNPQHGAFLCSPECIEVRNVGRVATAPEAAARHFALPDHRQALQSRLAQAQQAVTEARAELAHTATDAVHERDLTRALTLITGVRFALNNPE